MSSQHSYTNVDKRLVKSYFDSKIYIMTETAEIMKVNPDIQKERDAATIDMEELAVIIYGKEQLSKKRKLEDAVFNDPDYKCVPSAFLSREEEYEEGLRKSSLAVLKQSKLSDLIEDHKDIMAYNSNVSSINVLFDLNYGMFATTVLGQGTTEQQAKWLIPSLSHEIIGTYAQTEMGHGTFLRGLETTAHYDPNTQEFILNSPTISSIKWWPGALGKTSTHAVVLAQLYTLGKCHGIHPFVVQLRSLDDHKPLRGITVGDIGPKMGFGPNDNGYLKLHKHRIPRTNMLMKYSQVSPDGTYTKPPRSTLTYGTMTFVRVLIVHGSAIALAKASTIAIRYSAVRRQSELRPGEPEPQILSYPTQQHKLFPLLATAYAFHFVQLAMMKIYTDVNDQINNSNFSRIQELHALSSGLKAFTSWVTNAGLEVCRMSCGGHGYSQASGFPRLYADFTPSCTYEGENTVLMLQSARYLVKCVRDARSGKTLPGTVSYLSEDVSAVHSGGSSGRDLSNLDFLISLYKQRASNQVHFASDKVDRGISAGMDLVGALNSASVHLVSAAKAHSHYFIAKTFVESLKLLKASSELQNVLHQLASVYVFEGIAQSSGDFIEDYILSGSEAKTIRQLAVDLLPLIRVNAVSLVDAFSFRDEVLQSVLGRYDGNVYENLFKWAQNSPLNKTDVHPSYHKYLGPLLKRNQSKL
ncbi:peroxisomal acyl-coenzyme A oxidase 1-like isoform X2 [Clavelina lepadiformis]|uniref:Acyl-coenzyme A oxidase n=1 Tax=Clavelina lepadiformis TaxID=159417 RepID=A0ABP0FJ83_CLALP